MFTTRTLALLIVALSGCAAPDEVSIGSASNELIFGDDDRVEASAVEDPALSRAVAATGALVASGDMSCGSGGSCQLETSAMTTGRVESGVPLALCPGAANLGQQRGATCSAFLVGPRLLATAGHCISSQADCLSTQVVFDFLADADGQNEVTTFDSTDVYSCTNLVAQAWTNAGGDDGENDWAVLKWTGSYVDVRRLPSGALVFLTSAKS